MGRGSGRELPTREKEANGGRGRSEGRGRRRRHGGGRRADAKKEGKGRREREQERKNKSEKVGRGTIEFLAPARESAFSGGSGAWKTRRRGPGSSPSN